LWKKELKKKNSIILICSVTPQQFILTTLTNFFTKGGKMRAPASCTFELTNLEIEANKLGAELTIEERENKVP
jgi:hypothetical protein